MKKIHQKYIDQLFDLCGKALLVSFAILLLLLFLSLLPKILDDFDIYSNIYYEAFRSYIRPIIGLVFCVVIVLLPLLFLLVPFSSGERDKRDAEDIASPLINLTKEQQNKIIDLLKEKGAPKEGEDKMNRAKVTYILNALKDLGYIPSAVDDNTLRLWVIKKTGYKEDDLDHFRESMGRSQKNNIALRTKEMIEKMLSNGA